MIKIFNKKIKISSNSLEILRWIAIIAMIADHIGFTVFHVGDTWYSILRLFGRIAFPLFVFILVYNYIYNTSNKTKYIKRLFIFAVVSQSAFVFFTEDYNLYNIFMTLAMSLFAIYVYENMFNMLNFVFCNHKKEYIQGKYLIVLWASIVISIASFFVIIFSILKSDYGMMGLLLILTTYFWIKKTNFYLWIILIMILIFLDKTWFIYFPTVFIWTLFSLIIIISVIIFEKFSKNKKIFRIKRINKWFFYLFYPIHLIIIKIFSLM